MRKIRTSTGKAGRRLRLLVATVGLVAGGGAGGVLASGLLMPAPAGAQSCTTFVSGSYLGTWEANAPNSGIAGSEEFDFTFNGSSLSGSMEMITGAAGYVIVGNTLSGTVGCTSFSATLAASGGPVSISGTEQASGTLSGTWSGAGLTGTWVAGPVFAQVSNPSTTSLSTGSSTSSTDPIQATVTSPTAGPISIATAVAIGTSLPGYTMLDTFVQITAPTATDTNPLALTFLLDPSVTNGQAASSIIVFQNGAAVGTCTATSPISPDPCESSAVTLANGDMQITVLTSSASVWAFGHLPDSDLALSTPANITTDATGPQGATVSYPLPTVSDPDDTTVPTPTCTPAPGSVFGIGSTTVSCSVSDADDANSPATTTFIVSVQGAAAQLSDLSTAVQGVGPGTSLSDKVAQAESYLALGDISDTCGTLGAFVNEVQAQSGKHIPADQAAALVTDAQRIEAVLPC